VLLVSAASSEVPPLDSRKIGTALRERARPGSGGDERLRDVEVSAFLDAVGDGAVLVEDREHDDADLAAGGVGADGAEDFEAVHLGEDHVEDDEGGVLGDDLAQGLFAVRGGDDLVAVALQLSLEEPHDLRMIVYDEDLRHAPGPPGAV